MCRVNQPAVPMGH